MQMFLALSSLFYMCFLTEPPNEVMEKKLIISVFSDEENEPGSV